MMLNDDGDNDVDHDLLMMMMMMMIMILMSPLHTEHCPPIYNVSSSNIILCPIA